MNPAHRLLLLSSSRTAGTGFLEHARRDIERFLDGGGRRAVFLPYAGVRMPYDQYTGRVRDWFAQLGCDVSSLHRAGDPVQSLAAADLIIVGGGNTFQLLHELYRHDLIDCLRRCAAAGTTYIGWSAGSNIACPSIRTTNDMPVIWPPACEALDLIPFQINPHYTDVQPAGHQGETRAERLTEFATLNPEVPVVGLREGSALRIEHGKARLLGTQPAYLAHGDRAWEAAPGCWIDELLQPSDG